MAPEAKCSVYHPETACPNSGPAPIRYAIQRILFTHLDHLTKLLQRNGLAQPRFTIGAELFKNILRTAILIIHLLITLHMRKGGGGVPEQLLSNAVLQRRHNADLFLFAYQPVFGFLEMGKFK